MKYFLVGVTLLAIAIFTKYLCDFVRAVRYHQWKQQRDNLTLDEFVKVVENEYCKPDIKELCKYD
jgi:hypothetical protein